MFISDHSNKNRSRLKESALVKMKNCGCCGGDKFDRLNDFSTIPDINIIRCKKCGAITYDKIYNQEEIDLLYQEIEKEDAMKYYVDENGNQSNITFYGAQRFAKHLLKKYKKSKKRYRILDFGGGDGQLSYYVGKELQNRFGCDLVEIIVVDYNDKLYDVNNKKITMKHCFPLESIKDEKKFDIIIASGIIEHLPEPIDYIHILFEMLNTEGILYFRTPYIYPLYRDLKRIGIDYDTIYPFHIWDLGPEWYNNLLQNLGYDKNEISIISSRPSIVEKTFKANFWIALASYMLKAPWYICHKWPYVGGWEAIFTKYR